MEIKLIYFYDVLIFTPHYRCLAHLNGTYKNKHWRHLLFFPLFIADILFKSCLWGVGGGVINHYLIPLHLHVPLY